MPRSFSSHLPTSFHPPNFHAISHTSGEHHRAEEGDEAGHEEGHGADDKEQDNGLMAEFTYKVVMLEQDMLSKSECISALSGHVDDLKAKNGNYARELSRGVTVNDMVDASHENIDRMVQLE